MPKHLKLGGKIAVPLLAQSVDDIATQLVHYDNKEGLMLYSVADEVTFVLKQPINGQRPDNKDLIQAWQNKYPKGTYVAQISSIIGG